MMDVIGRPPRIRDNGPKILAASSRYEVLHRVAVMLLVYSPAMMSSNGPAA